jgi:hypothetical protein
LKITAANDDVRANALLLLMLMILHLQILGGEVVGAQQGSYGGGLRIEEGFGPGGPD